MEPVSIFAIISLVMSVVMTAGEVAAQAHANKENKENQQQLLNQQQQFATESAAEANRVSEEQYMTLYSPIARVRQIKEAGLSPGLIYGGTGVGGSGGTTAQAATPSPTSATINPLLQSGQMNNVMNALKTLTEAKNTAEDTKNKVQTRTMVKAEIDKIYMDIKETEANTKKIQEETKTEVITQNFQILQNKLAELDVKFQNETFEKRVQTIEEEYNLIKENIKKTGKEIDVMDIEYKWKPKLYENTIKLNSAQIELLGQQKLVAIAQEALTYLQTASEEARQQLMREQSNETAEKAYQINVTTKQLEEQLKEIQNFGYSATNSDTWIGVLLGTLKKASTLLGNKIK